MNSDTGKIYSNPEDIRAALKRGEPLEPIGPRVAEQDKHWREQELSTSKNDGASYQHVRTSIRYERVFAVPAPKPALVLTDLDLDQLAAAQAKRDRKQQTRAKGKMQND